MSSSTSENKIERYNLYKSRMDQAANQVIRKILFLVRPDEDFPEYRVDDIEQSYNLWRDEEEYFWRMTSTHVNPKRIFPAHPALYAPRRSCWRMWGLLIQQQVDSIDQSDLLDDCVDAILAAPRCQGECPCKVSNNPWTSYCEVAALAPLNVSHHPRCHCGDYGVCEKKHEAMAAAAEILRVEAETAKEKAKAEATCSKCDDSFSGKCIECYMKVCSYNSAGRLKAPDEIHMLRQGYYMEEEWYAKSKRKLKEQAAAEAEAKPAEHSTNCMCGVCFWKREAKEGRYPPVVAPRPATVTRNLMPSQNIVSTITAACSNQDDMAKQIFAAMGTPYDSKCPHGLPFYACMPCSH